MAEVRILRLIWFSFMVSIAVFQVVLFVAAPPAEPIDTTALVAIGASAIGPAVFGLVGVPMVLWRSPAQSAYIIRFACFESVAVFGFVAGFSSGIDGISVAAAGVAWMLLVSAFPTDERYTAWEVRRLGGEP